MSVWRAVKLLLTLRCEESTRLISDAHERRLTAVERWAVRLHQLSCAYCRKVAQQLRLVDDAARATASHSAALPPAARRRISTALADDESESQ